MQFMIIWTNSNKIDDTKNNKLRKADAQLHAHRNGQITTLIRSQAIYSQC